MMLSKQCPDGQAPASGFNEKSSRVNDMTFSAAFERQADRLAPLALLVIGMLTAFATAGIGF